MKTMQSLIIIAFLVSPLLKTNGQSIKKDWNKTFQVDELKADLHLLEKHINKIHAGLHTYISKDSLDLVFDQIENSINKPMTSHEFYRKITPLLKYVRNGHTNILPNEYYVEQTQKELPRFPFYVYWNQKKLYITKNMSSDSLIQDGAVLEKINGIPANDIFWDLVDNNTRDGFNLTNPILETVGRFSLYYAYQKGTPDFFDLELINPNGKKYNTKIKAITLAEIRKSHESKYGTPKKHWSQTKEKTLLFKVKDGTAIMTIKTFSKHFYKKAGQNFEKFFKESFEEIKSKGINNLIIDMRDNGGGDPEPTIALFSHLHDKPFTFYKEISTITRRIPNPGMYKDFLFFTHLFAPFMTKKEGDKFHIKGIAGIKESKPAETIYKGNLYVLTNGNSFSATGEMSSIIKNANIATFIGEETGGNPVQNTSGSMLKLVLPNTKTRVILPIVLWIMNVELKNTGRGVIPDHQVSAKIDDKLSGRDTVMDYTFNIINSGKNSEVK